MNSREVWSTSEWRQQAEQWIDAVLEALGVVRLGPAEQPRIRFWSTQLTVPTDHGTLWFKENNLGQLTMLLRARSLVDVQGYHQVDGQPFSSAELVEAIERLGLAPLREEVPA